MSKAYLLFGLLAFWGYTCTRYDKAGNESALLVQADTTLARQQVLEFSKDIMPIFKTHCMPCHFPGGSQYARLPFDQAKTLIDHQPGIFKRIKDPGDISKLKAYFEQASL